MLSTSLVPTLPSADGFQHSDLDSQHTDLSRPGYAFWGRHFPSAEEEDCEEASPFRGCSVYSSCPLGPAARPHKAGQAVRNERRLPSLLHPPPLPKQHSLSSFPCSQSWLLVCVCVCMRAHASEGRDNKARRRCCSFVSLVFL